MEYINGLVQDWSNPIANTLELLQSCTIDKVCVAFVVIGRLIGNSYWFYMLSWMNYPEQYPTRSTEILL